MPKTITSVGIEKIGRRFADSIDHAAYTLNGAPKTVEPFRKIVTADALASPDVDNLDHVHLVQVSRRVPLLQNAR